MRRIVISGLVALAAVLGGFAVPAVATAQPTATAARAGGGVVATRTAGTAVAANGVEVDTGAPEISCVLATDCLGVEGSSSIGTGGPSTPTRAERWNGSSWKGVRVTLPKRAKSADLNGVSCKAARSCLVVGDYYTSTSQSAASHALALSYNGTALKPTPTVPLPKGTTDAAFAGVSCTTTRYCVALGTADGNTAPFGAAGSLIIIETWNGAAWTLHTAPAMLGNTALELSGVSCATSAFCVLAGEAVIITSNSAATRLYVAAWNGKKLTTMKPATASGGKGLQMPAGVSCGTASNCAVTGATKGVGIKATATASTEIWNGKTWQLATVTWPKGIGFSLMFGVSCYGAHSCDAVGTDSANPQTSSFDAAAVSYTGTAGTVQAVPEPPKDDLNELTAVSCLPWGSCVAVGETGKTTGSSLALMTGVWNGKTWKLDPGF